MVLIVLKLEHLGKEIFSEFNPKLRHQKISYSKCIFMYIAIFSFFHKGDEDLNFNFL